MKLLKKRWFAVLVAVVLVVAAVAIGRSRSAANQTYQPESAAAAERWGKCFRSWPQRTGRFRWRRG